MPEKTTATATERAPLASFGEITYDKAGTYEYTITEVNDGVDGVSYDTNPHNVIVTVTKAEDATNKLTAEVTYDDSEKLVITNTFTAVKAPIEATKEFNDWSKADSFTFELTAVNGAPMPAGKSPAETEADGTTAEAGETAEAGTDKVTATATQRVPTASFGEITYDKAGTYEYTITEVNDGVDGVSYDTVPHNVVVTVTKADDATNALSAVVTYDGAESLTISNTFTAAKATLEATKKLDIWGKGKEFTFDLAAVTEGAPVPEVTTGTATKENPLVKFGEITYDKAGTYEYTITEQDGKAPGVAYDTTPHKVVVTVTKAADATNALSAAVKYDSDNGLVITNTYHASGSIKLEAEKKLNGRKLAADQFTFELLDETGEVLQTKKNAEDGSVVFDEISYTEADAGKTFNYTIKEHIPEGASKNADGTWTKDSYTYDGTEHAVKVEVKDNEDGTLKITYDGKDEMDKVTFTNEYKADGTTALTAHKNLVNGTLTEKLFSFELLDAEGKVLQTKGNAADGNVSFDAIKYQTQDAGKEFTYTIREKIPADAVKNDSGNWVKGDYVYDGHTVTVTVKVTDAGNGKLETATTYAGGTAAFTNTHVVTDIRKVTEDGTNLAGATLRVVDSTGKIVAEWTSDSSLKQLTGLKDGKYTLVEVSAPAGYAKAADISFTMKDGVLQGFDDGVINMVDARIRGNGGGGPSGGKDRKKPDKPTVPTRNTPDTPTGSVLGATRDVGHQVLGAVRTRPQEVLGAVRTGDTSAMLDMAAIFMAALSTLGAWFVYFFRKRREMHSN